jgi:hypothetical protein
VGRRQKGDEPQGSEFGSVTSLFDRWVSPLYCPHYTVWPKEAGDPSSFMRLFAVTHVARWQEHRHLVGTGHVYQGCYKSFPVETVLWYVSPIAVIH